VRLKILEALNQMGTTVFALEIFMLKWFFLTSFSKSEIISGWFESINYRRTVDLFG